MKPRSVLILAALVAALAAFLWLVDRKAPSTDERSADAKKLVAIEAGDVERVVLESSAGRLVLVREATEEPADTEARRWRLEAPVDARADGDEVESFLEALTGLEVSRSFADGDPAQLGLEEPRARVTVTAAETEITIRLGAPVPASANTIADLGPGTEFRVVPDSLSSDFEKAVEDWRSRELLPVASDALLELAVDSTGVRLRRAGDGFELVAPFADRADRDAAREVFDGLAGLTVERFVDVVPGDAMASPLVLSLAVEGREAPLEVRVGAPDQSEPTNEDGQTPLHYVATDEGTYLATIDFLELLSGPAAGWQSRAWTETRPIDVTGIEVLATEEDGEALSLARSEGSWRRDGAEIDYSLASDLLYALTGVTGARGEDLVSLALVEPEEPAALRIRLTLDGDSSETLSLHAWNQDYLAVGGGREFGVVVPADGVADVEAKVAALRSAQALVDDGGAGGDDPVQ